MSIKVMSHVWDNSKAEGSALLLLLAIADHCHDNGMGAWPSIARLSARTRQSERNTQYLIRKMQRAGELIIHNNAGPQGVNLYQIPVPWVGCKVFTPGDKSGVQSSVGGVKTSAKTIRQFAPDPSVPVTSKPSLLSGKPDEGVFEAMRRAL